MAVGQYLSATLKNAFSDETFRLVLNSGILRLGSGRDDPMVAEITHHVRGGGWKIRVAKGFDMALVCAFVLTRELCKGTVF